MLFFSSSQINYCIRLDSHILKGKHPLTLYIILGVGEAVLLYKTYMISDDINVHSGSNVF